MPNAVSSCRMGRLVSDGVYEERNGDQWGGAAQEALYDRLPTAPAQPAATEYLQPTATRSSTVRVNNHGQGQQAAG